MSHFNNKTGLPDFAVSPPDLGYEVQRWKSPEESAKRALERIMIAVIIYNKATGKDQVPGFKGSISEPFLKAIIKGTDPKDLGYWGKPFPNDQVGEWFTIFLYGKTENLFNSIAKKPLPKKVQKKITSKCAN